MIVGCCSFWHEQSVNVSSAMTIFFTEMDQATNLIGRSEKYNRYFTCYFCCLGSTSSVLLAPSSCAIRITATTLSRGTVLSAFMAIVACVVSFNINGSTDAFSWSNGIDLPLSIYSPV